MKSALIYLGLIILCVHLVSKIDLSGITADQADRVTTINTVIQEARK